MDLEPFIPAGRELEAAAPATASATARPDDDGLQAATISEGMTQQEAVAYAKLKSFCSNLLKKLAPPLLKEVQASSSHVETIPCTPRRNTRVAKRSASSSVAKATLAENMLLRTLGLVPEDMIADDDAVQELKDLFDSPLWEQHVTVIAALFGKTAQLQEAHQRPSMEIMA